MPQREKAKTIAQLAGRDRRVRPCEAGRRGYSYLSASIGFISEARRAG